MFGLWKDVRISIEGDISFSVNMPGFNIPCVLWAVLFMLISAKQEHITFESALSKVFPH